MLDSFCNNIKMQTTISVVVMLWLSAASDAAVSVRDCTACSNEKDYWKSRVNQPETSSLFTFGYHQGDMFSTRIYLKNIAVNVFPEVYIKHMLVSGENILKKKLQKLNEESFYRIRSLLSNAKVAIDVELFTRTGFCSLEQIVNGIDLSQPSEKTKYTKYNEVCLRTHWCEIVVDLENKCGGMYVHETSKPQIIVKPKSKTVTASRPRLTYFRPFFKNTFSLSNLPTSHKTMDTTKFKVTASDTRSSVVHETNEPMRTTTTATHLNTFKQNTFIPYVPSPTHTEVPTSPHGDREKTTIKSTASDTNPFFKKTFSPSNLPTSHKTMDTTKYKVTASDTSSFAVHETNEPMRTTTTATHINTFKQNTFIPYVPSPTHTEVPTSPPEDMDSTTIKSTASDTNAQPATSTTNYVIMVNSSIAAAAVVLLVIVAIRTRCWAKPDTPARGTSQLSTNENNYKLRQNLPMRTYHEYEIIDSEYEAIDAEYESIDTDENLYEEIIL